MKKHFLLSLFFCVFSCNSFAQTPTTDMSSATPTQIKTEKKVDLLLYGGIGAVAYRGDLADSYQKWSSWFHIGLQKNRRRWLNPRVEVFYGTLSGQNSAYTFEGGNPNLFFQTSLIGGSMNLQLNIIKQKSFMLYVSQGLGLAYYWIEDKNGNNLDKQPQTRTLGEVYSPTLLLLPSSIGATYLFPNQFGLGVEAGLQNTMTDYLDNISKWGKDTGNDNALRIKFSFYAPVVWK